MEFHSGFIALVGRPSSGKSTLLNALCGQKVAITSPKPQTTRNIIRGIVNRPGCQLIFLDTPGFTEAEDYLALQLQEELQNAIHNAEAVLYLMDLSRPPRSLSSAQTSSAAADQEASSEEIGLLRLLQRALQRQNRPLFFAFNKKDCIDSEDAILPFRKLVSEFFPEHPDSQTLLISAKKKDGLEELVATIAAQMPVMPEGQGLYDEDIYTDQLPQFRIQELIREQALPFCGQELPYALRVEVADLEYQVRNSKAPAAAADPVLWIRAFLQVERESQKGILVGKGGKRIKEIRQRSAREIRRQFACEVQLDLQVKLDYKWRRKGLS